ncbi:MAG: hypothetical protein IPG59_22560 [Candidatus Melainabacteria bacterium]|nr:MAG: hypothetical protein IPG59_22560 [Candidatus Melainabacteria bacterium]
MEGIDTMVISKKLVFAFTILLSFSQASASELNRNTIREARQLQLVLDAAKLAAIPQSDNELRKGGIPWAFKAAIKKIARIEDLKKLVFILQTMMQNNSEAGLQHLYEPLERSFFFTINKIASFRTPEAQEALDQIRSDCPMVGDAGGSILFKEICRKNKMKCLKLPDRTFTSHKKEYE